MGGVGRRFFVSSSSDRLCRSCMISDGRGCFLRLFQSKHACFAFSSFGLLGELLVAKLKRRLFSFLPMFASNCRILVTSCCVISSVLFISATSEASLYGVLFLSALITRYLRFSV